MSEDMEEWLCDSNEAMELSLIRSPEDTDALDNDIERGLTRSFHPTFTYPIFGEQEKIFGYKDLSIWFAFASGSLKSHLEITYSAKIDSEATPADDVEGKIFQFIPPDYSRTSFAFDPIVDHDADHFTPLGDKIGSYVRKVGSSNLHSHETKGKGKEKMNGDSTPPRPSPPPRTPSPRSNAGDEEEDEEEDDEEEEEEDEEEDDVIYEMYKTTWSTPGWREYHRRMQIFILLFIEGGSYIQEDEEAWEFITLYEKRRKPDGGDNWGYHFIGYTSVYPFWCYPDQVRLRLSQFVILPPFQQKGHGAKLYETLYLHALSRPEVAELTVEDPAEAFEDLRDRCDLRYLVAHGLPRDPQFKEGVGAEARGPRAEWEKRVRKRYKIAERQFNRLLEMLLLRELDETDADKVKAYRLCVKARLYRHNYEMLSQMTPEERKDGLQRTYGNVVEDYRRILDMAFH